MKVSLVSAGHGYIHQVETPELTLGFSGESQFHFWLRGGFFVYLFTFYLWCVCVRVRVRVGVRVRVRVRVRVGIKPLPLSRYPLALKGILFGGPAMEKSLDTRRR